MFDTSDLAALPTNIALTLWDALPVLLAVGASMAILAATILPNQWRIQWLRHRAIVPVEGVAFLAIFSQSTALIVAAMSAITFLVATRLPSRVPDESTPERRGHSSPASLVRIHVGQLFGQSLLAAALLGVFEIILRPSFETPELLSGGVLALVAAALGIIPSSAAIIALAFVEGTEATIAAALILAGSFAGQLYRSNLRRTPVETSLADDESEDPGRQ